MIEMVINMTKTIGFIGVGNMGGAIIKGILKNNLVLPKNIILYDKNTSVCKSFSDEFDTLCAESIEAVSKADILFLAVKPNVLYDVIDEIKDVVGTNTVIVSIAAGQSISSIEKAFNIRDLKLVRVMPNTPALVGEGMSALCLNSQMSATENKESCDFVLSLFKALGKAELVSEHLIDAVTGVSGSSPAYVFMFIEAMADAAVLAGMTRESALTFCAQSVLGSAKMVLETNTHPAILKDMVCSPGGTTIEAVKVLEAEGFRSAVMNAVSACIKKSKELGK